jgi:hypothetical protein
MKNDFITFAAFLWQDPARRRSYKFTTQHPIILRNMLKRQCSIPHEFLVITDSREAGEALSKEGIRCVPLDKSKHVPGACAVKLMARRPDIGGILGRRIALLDLDIVIVRNVDDIFGREEPNVMFRNPNYRDGGQRAFYQGSIQLFDAGVHSYLYTEFDPAVTPGLANRRFGGMEQAWISERLGWDEPHWTAEHGIYGAGRLFDGKPDGGVTSELPENAKIVVVPGDREPSQEHVQRDHEWIKEFYW